MIGYANSRTRPKIVIRTITRQRNMTSKRNSATTFKELTPILPRFSYGSINFIGIKMGVMLKEAVLQHAKKFTPKAIVFQK
jgi:hypothetical protein